MTGQPAPARAAGASTSTPGEVGQAEVEHHEVGVVLAAAPARAVRPSAGDQHLVALGAQRRSRGSAQGGVVLDQQDPHRRPAGRSTHHGQPAARGLLGVEACRPAPRPGRGRRPGRARRPSPEAASPSRWNGSNIRRALAAATPGPWSTTRSRDPVPVAPPVTSTAPSVWRSALPTQVGQHPLEQAGVAPHASGSGPATRTRPSSGSPTSARADDVVERHVARAPADGAGLEPAHVEQVGDDRGQPGGGLLDGVAAGRPGRSGGQPLRRAGAASRPPPGCRPAGCAGRARPRRAAPCACGCRPRARGPRRSGGPAPRARGARRRGWRTRRARAARPGPSERRAAPAATSPVAGAAESPGRTASSARHQLGRLGAEGLADQRRAAGRRRTRRASTRPVEHRQRVRLGPRHAWPGAAGGPPSRRPRRPRPRPAANSTGSAR